jgi:hypothetical protein
LVVSTVSLRPRWDLIFANMLIELLGRYRALREDDELSIMNVHAEVGCGEFELINAACTSTSRDEPRASYVQVSWSHTSVIGAVNVFLKGFSLDLAFIAL